MPLVYWIGERESQGVIDDVLHAAAYASVGWLNFLLVLSVARDVLLLSGLGVAIGLVAAAAVGRLVESRLFGLSARDGLALGAAACLMGLVAIAASYAPVRRATRVDPMLALRHE